MEFRKKKGSKLVLIFLFFIVSGSYDSTDAQIVPMENYCMQPPFVGRALRPNVLIIMDNSGSMGEKAYATNWDPNASYYGYFDQNQWYVYNNTEFVPVAPKTDPKQPEYWDGAFLNWATMRRMDIVRKVLVGGKAASRSGQGNPHTLIGEPNQGSYTPVNITVTNAGNYIDQRQNNANVTAPNISSFSNATRTSEFPCVGVQPPSPNASVSWNLTGSGGNLTNCVRIRLRAPNGTYLMLKDFGVPNPGIFDITMFYNGAGPGIYRLEVTETNTGSGCNSGTISVSNIAMSVTANPIPPTGSFTFRLSAGGSSSQLTTVGACSSNNKNVKIKVPTEPLGIVQKTDPDVRFGLQFFNISQGGRVVSPVQEDNPSSFVTAIENEPPSTWTPLAENIWTATGYFAQNSTSGSDGPRYTGNGGCASANQCYQTGPSVDPYNFGTAGQPVMVPCAKSFILVVTDGLPTQDLNLPTSVDNISPTYANGCSTGSFPCNQSGSPLTSNCCLDNATMYAHVDLSGTPKYRDLRPDLVGDQYVTTYLVFASFGEGGGGPDGVMAVAARNGGFQDINGNFVPDLQEEYDRDNDGLPDTYFEAQNGDELEAALTGAIRDILRRSASATANSVIGAGKGQGANLLQAFFYPRKAFGNKELDWVGFLQNLWFQVDPLLRFTNIREDTQEDDVLHLINDKIVSIFFDAAAGDVRIQRFEDANGDGFVEGTFGSPLTFEELTPVWEAGKLLFSRDPATRTIFTTVDNATLESFDVSNLNLFYNPPTANLLQAIDTTDATNIIEFVRGTDISGARSRTATIGGTTGVWKLGDNVNSTAKIQGPFPLNDYHQPQRYSDETYKLFISSVDYRSRGMVYSGGNDGMLHAFYLGKLQAVNDPARPNQVVELLDPNSLGKGEEQWAFVPKNALPYLRYLMDRNYCHLYYVDSPPVLFDASISDSSVSADTYHDVVKKTVLDDQGTPDPNDDTLVSSTWRTILIGSMGLGGGCGCSGANCVASVQADHGLSSYFALDVTDPLNPELLWEFSHPELGFTTSEPAIIKISARDANGDPDRSKNGHWFVVLASGPTGDVETVSHQFRGRSAQRLKFFVLRLKDGQLMRIIDSPIAENAFAGNFSGVIDSDLDYQDEVAYVGYTRQNGTNWNQGGVLRLLTKDDPDPNNWEVLPFIQDIGPVTAKVAALTAEGRRVLWLYFGTGRYHFKDSSGNIDDADSQRRLFGIKEPCYEPDDRKYDLTCSDVVSFSDLDNATTDVVNNPDRGWFINLDPSSGLDKAERVITSPEVSNLGVVFFTTFSPSADPCSFGGKSFIWAIKFDTGGSGASFLYGTALLQTSTGAIEQMKLQEAFVEKAATSESVGRRTAAFVGQPPRESGPMVFTPPPMKRILRIKER